jgi:hypothetical protein
VVRSGGISSGIGSGISAMGGDDYGQILGGGLGGGIGSAISGGDFWEGFGQGIAVGAFNHALHSGFSGRGDPPTKEELKVKMAKEYLSGKCSQIEYLHALDIIDNNPAGVLQNVWEFHKTEIVTTAMGVGFVKLLSSINSFRLIKSGFLLNGNRLQIHKHALNYFRGKGLNGSLKAWHINFGGKHLILNPLNWGKLTSKWYNPFK